MTPERWAHIKEIFGAALEKPEAERAAYLERACGADAPLRQQVERLLAEKDGSLENPVVAILQRVPPRELSSGELLGHYRVEVKLGQGGMGAVYKAYDTHLQRPVALKVLAAEQVARRSLIEEARAASTLSHPNIITVHDVATDNGTDFIAMEYVQGKRLDQVIPRKGLRLEEALRYALQIADALAAAHAAGIVHRDLKPGNIMVTAEGRVKVLDFGLARRMRLTKEESASLTVEGELAGTPSYMSPEQAQGKKVDARSDIFSFGVVFYEMLTGQRAFERDSKISTLAAILKEEPKPAGEMVGGLPDEVDRLIGRCLRKDPDRRIQHMAEVKVLLEELKEESDSAQLETAAAASKRGRQWRWVAAVLGVFVIGAGVWFGISRWMPGEAAPTVVPLTSDPGIETEPTFSPDGNQVAFAWNGEKQNNFDIYVQLIRGGERVRLTSDALPDRCPAWSPDGQRIAFFRLLPGGAYAAYLISPLGGMERKVGEFHVSSANPKPLRLAWSPDNRYVVVSDWPSPTETPGLWRISVETGQKTRLTSPPAGWTDTDPACSPDGHSLAFIRETTTGVGDVHALSLFEGLVPKGEAKRLTFHETVIWTTSWTPDSREVVFGFWNPTDFGRLWKVSASGADKPQPLPFDGHWPVLSRTGRRLAYARLSSDSNIWRVELDKPGGRAKSVSKVTASTRRDANPQFSPDGKRIVFASLRSGTFQVWICDRDGSNALQLTSFGMFSATPRWSPDGSRIAFDALLEKQRDIFVVGIDGGKPQQLTESSYDDAVPSWSRDGKWIYFTSSRTGSSQIWKVPATGGEAVQVTKNGGYVAFESADGQSLYYTKNPRTSPLCTASLAGGKEREVLESVHQRAFAVTARGIYYIPAPAGPGTSIRFLSFATGKSTTIAELGQEIDLGLAVSPDERTLVYTQKDLVGGDLMLVENFR